MGRRDRRGTSCFVDVTTIQEAACPIDRAQMLPRFHASENGTLLSAAPAFAAMWRAIPLLRALKLVARMPMVLSGIEFFYRAFLRVRPRLQRLVATARPA
jgi:predicted DCC family thiol-disulfide oxidoreductase YuxK